MAMTNATNPRGKGSTIPNATRPTAKIQWPSAQPRATDIPVYQWADWNSVYQAKAAIHEHEQGIFELSALLVDAMRADDRLFGTIQTRIAGVFSLSLQMRSVDAVNDPDSGDEPVLSADEQVSADFAMKHWSRMFQDNALAELHMWGLFLGVGVGENIWQKDPITGDFVPVLKVWHPKHLMWRWDTRSYWIATMEGLREVTPGDGQWVLYCPYGVQYGWNRALVRAAMVPYLIHQWAWRDAGRHSEVAGFPIKLAEVPVGDNDEDKMRFFRSVAQLGSESTVYVPTDPQNPGRNYGLKLLEIANDGAEFITLKKEADEALAILINGQSLTTATSAKGGGAFALGQVHERIRGDLLAFDALTICATIRRDILKPCARINQGNADFAALPAYNTEPPEDLATYATTLFTAGQALNQWRLAGVSVDPEKFAKKFKIPTGGKSVLAPLPPVTPPGAANGGGVPPIPKAA